MDLKARIARDTYRVFLKKTEFADELLIGTNSDNAVTVVASLQANEVDNNSGQGAYLQQFSHTLYIEYPIDGKLQLNAGQVIFINNVAYKVIDLTDEMGVATIHIQRG